MNIRVSSVLVMIGWATVGFGQEEIKSTHFGFSVTPQLNATIFKDKEAIEWNNTFGFAAAGNIHFDLSPKTKLVTGLEFQYAKYNYANLLQTGYIDSMGNLVFRTYYFENNFSLYFIGLPIQIKWKLGAEEKPNHLYFVAGATLRYRFASGGYVALVEDGSTTIKRDIDTFFWAPDQFWILGSIGFGYEMKCGNHKLSLAPTFEYSPGQLYNVQGSSVPANAHPAFLGICFSYY